MSNLKAFEDNEQLVRIENKQIVTDSRSVAEHFGKLHKHVLKSITNLTDENSSTKSMFFKTTFENRGKQYPMYLMNRDGFSLLVMGFTGKKALEWKLKYIEAFNNMEEELERRIIEARMDSYMIEDPVKRAKKWIEEEQARQKLLAENRYMLPKAEFYDTVINTESLLSMGEVAKVLDMGIGRNKLYKFLRDKNVLMDDNIPYQRYVDAGYFKLTEKHYMSGDDSIVSTSTYVKQKGVDFIRKLLQKDGYKRVERKQLKEILGKC